MKTLQRQRPGQSGGTLMELMMALAITGFAITAVTRFVVMSRASMTRAEATSELNYANRKINDNIRHGLMGAVEIVADYGGDPNFAPLRNIIHSSVSASATAPNPLFHSSAPVVVNAAMPDLTFNGSMKGNFGNELLYVASLTPVTLTACLSGTAVVSPCTYTTSVQNHVISVDRIQFVAIYLAQEGTRAMKNGLAPIRLVEWRSKPYVTLTSITESTGAYLTATCQALFAMGYTKAIGEYLSDTAGSFFSITGSGSPLFTAGAYPSDLGESGWAYIDEYNLSSDWKRGTALATVGKIKREGYASKLFGPANFSFAYNNTPTVKNNIQNAARAGGAIRVPGLATADRGNATGLYTGVPANTYAPVGFPGGFEVLVAGGPGSREIVARYVMMMATSDAVSRTKLDFVGLEGQTYTTVDARH